MIGRVMADGIAVLAAVRGFRTVIVRVRVCGRGAIERPPRMRGGHM